MNEPVECDDEWWEWGHKDDEETEDKAEMKLLKILNEKRWKESD